MARTHLIKKNRDEYYTTVESVDFLLQFLPSPADIKGRIWDPSPGPSGAENNISKLLIKAGYDVVCTNGDFLTYDKVPVGCTMIVSNPPYSLKSNFIAKCMFDLGIPWLFLLPLNTLASEIRCGWFRNNGVQIWVIPEKLTFQSTYHGKNKPCSFVTCWFGWRITSAGTTLTFLKAREKKNGSATITNFSTTKTQEEEEQRQT